MHAHCQEQNIDIYYKWCTVANVILYPHALFHVQTGAKWMGRQCFSHLLNTDHGSPRQTFLDGVVTYKPRIPAFTSAGLLNFMYVRMR